MTTTTTNSITIPQTRLPTSEELLRQQERSRFEAALTSGDEEDVQRGIDLGLVEKEDVKSSTSKNVVGASQKPFMLVVGSAGVAKLLLDHDVPATASEGRGSRNNCLHSIIDRMSAVAATTTTTEDDTQSKRRFLLIDLLAFLSQAPSAPHQHRSMLSDAHIITMLLHKNQAGLVPIQWAARVGHLDAFHVLFSATAKLIVAHQQKEDEMLDDDEYPIVNGKPFMLTSSQICVALRQTIRPLLHVCAMFGAGQCAAYLLSVQRTQLQKSDSADKQNDKDGKREGEQNGFEMPEEDNREDPSFYLYNVDDKLGDNHNGECPQPLSKYDCDCTAMHIAAANGHADVVELFVSGHTADKEQELHDEKDRKHRQWVIGREAHESVHGKPVVGGDDVEPTTPRKEGKGSRNGNDELEEVSPIKNEEEASDDNNTTPKSRKDRPNSALSPQEKEAVKALPSSEAEATTNVSNDETTFISSRLHRGNILAVDRMGRNVLHYAAEGSGKVPASGASSASLMAPSAATTASTRRSPVNKISGENVQVLNLLLEVDASALQGQDRGGKTPLEAALRCNRKVNAQLLMEFRRREQDKKEKEAADDVDGTGVNESSAGPKKIIVSGVEIDVSSFSSTHLKDATLTRDFILAGLGRTSKNTVVGNPTQPASIAAAAKEQSVSTLIIDHKQNMDTSGLGSLPPAVAASAADSSLWRSHTRGVQSSSPSL